MKNQENKIFLDLELTLSYKINMFLKVSPIFHIKEKVVQKKKIVTLENKLKIVGAKKTNRWNFGKLNDKIGKIWNCSWNRKINLG